MRLRNSPASDMCGFDATRVLSPPASTSAQRMPGFPNTSHGANDSGVDPFPAQPRQRFASLPLAPFDPNAQQTDAAPLPYQHIAPSPSLPTQPTMTRAGSPEPRSPWQRCSRDNRAHFRPLSLAPAPPAPDLDEYNPSASSSSTLRFPHSRPPYTGSPNSRPQSRCRLL